MKFSVGTRVRLNEQGRQIFATDRLKNRLGTIVGPARRERNCLIVHWDDAQRDAINECFLDAEAKPHS